MANDETDYFYQTPVLIVVLLAGIGVSMFGASNWSCYVKPPSPVVSADAPKERFDFAAENHRQKCEAAERGDGAVMAFVWTMPLTFVGLGCVLAAVGVLIHKHGK